MKVSFIIPTIKRTDLIETCLKSLTEKNTGDYEILVVDDGSSTEIQDQEQLICEKYKAKFLKNEINSGFSKTVNKGIKEANGDIIVLVNNDIVFTQDTIKPMIKSFEQDNKIGIVGALLFYPNGKIQHGGIERVGKMGFTHRGWHKYLKDIRSVDREEYLIGVTGALLGIRKEMIKVIGPLREDYFLSCEDTEYCIRAWIKGWRVFYNPQIKAIHAEGETRGNTYQTKMEKGKDWMDKENETSLKFRENLKSVNFNEIDKKIKDINTEISRKIVQKEIKEAKTILIRRDGAMGDVLLATGIVRALKEQNQYNRIIFSTVCGKVFKNNPNVQTVISPVQTNVRADVVFNLNNVYESNPKMNIIDAYVKEVFGDKIHDMNFSPEIFSQPIDSANVKIKLGLKNTDQIVVVHITTSWPNRTWKAENWYNVVEKLREKGYLIVVVGAGGDKRINPKEGIIDAYNKLSICEIKELIGISKVFIGMDSGLFHVAATTETPIIGLFTCVNPEYRCFERKGRTIAIIPKTPCRFCLHEEKPPVNFVGCKTGGLLCLEDIKESDILGAVDFIISSNYEIANKEKNGYFLYESGMKLISEPEINLEVKKEVVKEEPIERILIKRNGALGAVVCLTPIVDRLKKEKPNRIIDIETNFGNVFRNNPKINRVFPVGKIEGSYHYTFDLNNVYEMAPDLHIIEAYEKKVFGQIFDDLKSCQIIDRKDDKIKIDNIINSYIRRNGLKSNGIITIHYGVTVKNRSWDKKKWDMLTQELIRLEYDIVVIGNGADWKPQLSDRVVDLVGKLSIQEIKYLISISELFIGADNGLTHVAGCTETPIVSFYISTDPIKRMPYRKGKIGIDIFPILPDINCRGCFHKQKIPTIHASCNKGDYQCLESLTLLKVLGRIKNVLKIK